MKFTVWAILGALFAIALSFLYPKEDLTLRPPVKITTPELLQPPKKGDVINVLALAYDPYDDCVGKWQFVWPRKTPGGSEVETLGLGADPKIFSYGTIIKFHDPAICKFITETDKTNISCTLPVDDTGGAALEDTTRYIYHLELRVPRRSDFPNENAHKRALSFGRHTDTEIEIISSPSGSP